MAGGAVVHSPDCSCCVEQTEPSSYNYQTHLLAVIVLVGSPVWNTAAS